MMPDRPDGPTAALLARMESDLAGLPAEGTIANRRAALKFMADIYGPAPMPVRRIEERSIPTPEGALRLRIYHPDDAGAALPVLLHIHGGGWALGDPETYERICRAYCHAAGCIVVDVDYRRAPEHKYPAAYRDCQSALEWLAAHAGELGGEPGRIVVAGDSAGGNLAAAVCLHSAVPIWRQVLVYPVLSASVSADYPSRAALGDGRYFLTAVAISRAEEEYLSAPEQGEETTASPILANADALAAQPPTYIVAAGLDPLRDEAASYASRLRAAGVEVRDEVVEGTIHAFVLFAGAIPKGRAAIDSIGAWIRGTDAEDASMR